MPVRDLIIDTWSSLSHKAGLDASARRRGRSLLAPTWVGDHSRRLDAYKLLAAYCRNVAREFLPDTVDEAERAAHREYGDAALLVNVVVAALLGDDVSIVVDGAGEQDPEGNAVDPAADERQVWLDGWADTERMRAKMLETERESVQLGDGVYQLGWNSEKRRARLRIWDPGFYFPVLDPDDPEDEYPRRVHIAWQFERTSDGETKAFVRRITWSLEPIRPLVDAEGVPQATLPDGVTLDANRRRVRRYPWNDEPSPWACYMTDATWELSELGDRKVDDFDASRAVYRTNSAGQLVRDLDLGIDFVPVVHMPNTVAIKEHFGSSIIAAVAQILDDIAKSDTDLVAAAALAGTPMLGFSGTGATGDVAVRPGAMFNLGVDGRLSSVDLSASVQVLLDYSKYLLDRLSTNSRVPAEVLGRVKASDVAAGILMALSFGPLRALIEEMRLVRSEKHPLLLKFVQRFALLAGEISAPVMPAQVAFGSYLPSDAAAVIEAVSKLWAAKLIGRRTAIARLVDEGIVEGDLAELLTEAEADAFADALALMDATSGDMDAVYEFLHRERPEEEPTPPVRLPQLDPGAAGPGTDDEGA